MIFPKRKLPGNARKTTEREFPSPGKESPRKPFLKVAGQKTPRKNHMSFLRKLKKRSFWQDRDELQGTLEIKNSR
jgi:hypothetical protein